ncbi:MAG: hypothetical protein ISR83_05690 [Candidatus Marinimicrobia bacterium]|nr:hypothetical protein [Candidatus Neomarinimicrobiota bacterium]
MKLIKKYRWKKKRKSSHIKNIHLIDLNIDQYLLNRENRNQKDWSSK